MDLQLFSIDKAPRNLPIWDTILDDLSRPSAARVARALGVGESTVYRWNQRGQAPRMACLALFWLTRWGRSEVHTQALNDATMAVGLARSLAEERDRLRAQVFDLELQTRAYQAEQLEGRGWGRLSQSETFWKVLLEPSRGNPSHPLGHLARLVQDGRDMPAGASHPAALSGHPVERAANADELANAWRMAELAAAAAALARAMGKPSGSAPAAESSGPSGRESATQAGQQIEPQPIDQGAAIRAAGDQSDARPGTPASVPRASGPAPCGPRPQPPARRVLSAPTSQGAPPGPGVFAAIVRSSARPDTQERKP